MQPWCCWPGSTRLCKLLQDSLLIWLKALAGLVFGKWKNIVFHCSSIMHRTCIRNGFAGGRGDWASFMWMLLMDEWSRVEQLFRTRKLWSLPQLGKSISGPHLTCLEVFKWCRPLCCSSLIVNVWWAAGGLLPDCCWDPCRIPNISLIWQLGCWTQRRGFQVQPFGCRGLLSSDKCRTTGSS